MNKRWMLMPRALMLLVVLMALLGGLGSGLARLGWQMDALSTDWLLIHGPLMICGFLGTLICLERAVALSQRYAWALLVPMVNAMGTLALLLFPDAVWGKMLITAGSAGLLGLFVLMWRLHPSQDIAIMALGAVGWFIGNVLWWQSEPIFSLVHLWSAFLILTIVGERLELSRVRRLTPKSERWLLLAVSIYALGVGLTRLDLAWGMRILGLGAIAMALWLWRYDVAGRTIRQKNLPRYIAACLLSGYVWLGIGGGLALWRGAIYAGADYALVLHAFLLGFVFSMIFGHMPIIIPALTGLRVLYTPLLYVPLMILHASLSYRTYGNITGELGIQQWGGLWNVIAVLLFFGTALTLLLGSNLPKRKDTA